jgi:LPS-assembly protein
MPAFMPRPRPFLLAALLCAGMPPVARADDLLCPSQLNLSAAAAAPAAPGAAPAHPGADLVDITSDSATVGEDGKGLLHGNVVVRQGALEIRSNEMQYDRASGSIETSENIDYLDSLVHVTGAAGSYSASSGGQFRAAQFNLLQRSARGTAQEMKLTPQGVLDLDDVTFTTCPVNDNSWVLRAKDITLDTRAKIGTGHDARIDFMGVPILYLPWVLPAEQRPQERFSVPDHRQHLQRRAAADGSLLLEPRAQRRLHLPAHRVHQARHGSGRGSALAHPGSARRT